MAKCLPLRVAVVVAVSLLLLVAGRAAGSGVPTIHPTWLWTDLRPIGDGDISYETCDPYLPASPNWSYGVENWDATMGSLMDFDQYGCSLVEPPVVQMRYEDPEDADYRCQEGYYGCWTFPENAVPPPWSVGIILFDYDIYSSYTNAKKTAAAAHEWGHIMDLASVDPQNCTQPYRIMGGNGDGACILGPAWMEAWTVADLHGWSDFDSDGDSPWDHELLFSDAEELYVGTDPNHSCGYYAWPYDQDNNGLVNVGDALRYGPNSPPKGSKMRKEGDLLYNRRLDLNPDGWVNVGDLLMYRGHTSNEPCP